MPDASNHDPGQASGSKSTSWKWFLIPIIAIAVIVPLVVVDRLATHRRLLTEHQLKVLALKYHNFHDEHGRSPGNLEELLSAPDDLLFGSSRRDDVSLAAAMMRDGRFVLIWDAVLKGDGDENEKYVLGYEPNVPQSGGLVMRAGGSVRTMTAAEFARLPKIDTRAPGSAKDGPATSPAGE